MCPWGGNLMYGPEPNAELRKLVCHCLLIETPNSGLVLVDTGIGLFDVQRARERLSSFFLFLNRPRMGEQETALRQIQRLGFAASDVRHIVLTHLDFDHAGGLEDFPEAVVHVFGPELDAATSRRKGFIARNRYRPRQWSHAGAQWQRYDSRGAPWMGFETVRDLVGLPPEILLVPLTGHTSGHCGVAIQHREGWLLHAGDAYFYRGEMERADAFCPPGLRFYQSMMEVDRLSRLVNQRRLRELARGAGERIQVMCAHDPAEYARHKQVSRSLASTEAEIAAPR